jgi:hypothetical protein
VSSIAERVELYSVQYCSEVCQLIATDRLLSHDTSGSLPIKLNAAIPVNYSWVSLYNHNPHNFTVLYQVRVIMVFTVFRLLTDFFGLYTNQFWLSLCKIVRSSVILLLPLYWGVWSYRLCNGLSVGQIVSSVQRKTKKCISSTPLSTQRQGVRAEIRIRDILFEWNDMWIISKWPSTIKSH